MIQLKLFPAKCDTLQGYLQCVLWYKRFLYLFSMYLNFDIKNEEETFSRFLISEDSGFSRRIFSCSYIYWPIDFLPQNEFNISSNKVNPHKGHNVKFNKFAFAKGNFSSVILTYNVLPVNKVDNLLWPPPRGFGLWGRIRSNKDALTARWESFADILLVRFIWCSYELPTLFLPGVPKWLHSASFEYS